MVCLINFKQGTKNKLYLHVICHTAALNNLKLFRESKLRPKRKKIEKLTGTKQPDKTIQ